MMIKVAIADDDYEYAKRLMYGLEKYNDLNVSLYTEAKNLENALQTKKFDILLFSPHVFSGQVALSGRTAAIACQRKFYSILRQGGAGKPRSRLQRQCALQEGTHTIGLEFRNDKGEVKRAAQNYKVIGKSGGSASNNGGGGGGDDSPAQGGSGKKKAPSVEVRNQNFLDTNGLPYAELVFKDGIAKLTREIIRQYLGKNVNLLIHLGNRVGFSIMAENLAMLPDGIDLSIERTEMEGFAEGFTTISLTAATKTELPFNVAMHTNVGVEYAGGTAYIFIYDKKTGKYEIKSVETINEIGNVMIVTSEITDVMILVARLQ